MAALNTSIEGPAITKAYHTIVDSPGFSGGSAANSPTYGQWAVYAVQAPLASAFQQDSGKESVLKVFRTGEGELADLAEEFSEGKIQFGFAKVKDPNTTLPKYVLIAWCGQGVPERTKGYFTSHLAAVSKILHGYHVQVTARTDDDLNPDAIIRKVADASGSKYSGGDAAPKPAGGPPPIASKPVFMPSRVGGGGSSTFQPLGARSRQVQPTGPVDSDGWGSDAPQVTRSQLEKVDSAYKPTKVNMSDLTSQRQEPSKFSSPVRADAGSGDVVRGGYQPIGKVDIAAIRREAQEKGQIKDERPTTVKGSYEPVGKVDIAAIRAKAAAAPPPASSVSPAQTGASAGGAASDEPPKTLADRSAAFSDAGRISALPKPKVGNKFGASAFTGTKAPTPGGFDAQPAASSAVPVGAASRTFADEGGKTPAQLWAEKKAREGGSVAAPIVPGPMASQTSGDASGGGWQSGYTGKKWGTVDPKKPAGMPVNAVDNNDDEQVEGTSSGGIGALRDRFKGTAPMGAAAAEDSGFSAPPPPPMDLSSKPNTGIGRAVPVPGMSRPAEESVNVPPPPAQPPRTPTPEQEEQEQEEEMRASSPIRIIQPVARTEEKPLEPAEEAPPAMPVRSLAEQVPHEQELDQEPQIHAEDPARAAGQTAAETQFGAAAVHEANPGEHVGGKRAIVQFDYEKAEDNEIELREGEHVTNIEMVDEDWWMGQNSAGETGLFPSNYVELAEDEPAAATRAPMPAPVPAPAPAPAEERGQTATAQYDYEAAEENEISFPEGAKIANVEFPDDDWWLGEYGGKQGLFPANYVELDQ